MKNETQKIIVGLAGPEGVGKSTIAKTITERITLMTNFRAVAYLGSMAEPIYKALATTFGVTVEYIKEHKDEPFTAETAPVPCLIGMTWRDLLKSFGSGWGRDQVHSELWAQLSVKRQTTWAGKINLIVYDDVRFESEAKQIHHIFELKRAGKDYARTHDSNMGLPAHVPRTVLHVEEGQAQAAAIHIIRTVLPAGAEAGLS